MTDPDPNTTDPGGAAANDAATYDAALDDKPFDENGDTGAPICPACGVTALPAEAPSSEATFVCENPDCEAFGQPL